MAASPPFEDAYARERETLLAEVEAEFRTTAEWTGRDKLSLSVRAAMAGGDGL